MVMPTLFSVLRAASLADELEEIESVDFPHFTSLFLDADTNARNRLTRESLAFHDMVEGGEEESYDDDDDDDSETIIWLTPRAHPRKQGLEELKDGFDLDGPPSPTSSSSSSSSNSSEESYGNDGRFSKTGLMSLDRPASECEVFNLNEDEDEYEEWTDVDEEEALEDEPDDDFFEGKSILSNSDDDSVLARLFRHEQLLGDEFVYMDKAVYTNNYGTNLSDKDIVYDVQRTSDTYAAAMRLYLKWIDLVVDGHKSTARRVLRDIHTLATDALEEWLVDCPEENWPLGRARAALIGQMIRLEMMPDDYISDLTTGIQGDLHLDGRIHVLHALIQYAGPRAITEENLDAIDIIAEFCEAHPELTTVNWVFSKIKKDISAYMIRNRLTENFDGRFSRGELEDLLRKKLEGDESDSLYSLLDLVLDQRDQRIIAEFV